MIRQICCRGVCLVAFLLSPNHIFGQALEDPKPEMEAARFELPARVSHSKLNQAEIPELPKEAMRLPDLTLEFRQIQSGVDIAGSPEVVHVLTRSRNRAHSLLTGGVNREWLFLRNPVDPRRVSGSLFNHAERAIVDYFESDLRNSGVARGWLDVLSPAVDPRLLAKFTQTSETAELSGVLFRKLVPKEDRQDGILEVWWNSELLVPLRVTRRAAGVTQTYELTKLTRGVESDLLADPQVRFPRYATVDVADFADWKEEQ